MNETRVVNIVQVGDKVIVTIRYAGDPDTDRIYEGSMQDVMLE